MQGLEGKVGELGIRLAEHLHPGYTYYALENGAGNCPEAGTVVGDLIRLPLVGKVNVWLYKLPPECLKLSDLNVGFSLEGIDFDLGDIEIDFWEGLKDMGKGFAESLYFEKDPEDEKKVILRSEGQKVAAITLESKEKAEELVNISQQAYKASFPVNGQQLKLIFPNAKASDRQKYLPFINKYFQEYDINTCDRINHFFAQVEGEVLQFYYNVENLAPHVKSESTIRNSVFCIHGTKNPYRKYACQNPSEFVGKAQKFANYVYGGMLGNSVPISGDDTEGNGDGWRYRGRGAHQLTGFDNYRDFNDVLPKYLNGREVNVLNDPELVGADPELYILSAVWHWNSHGGNAAADKKGCDCICKAICPDENCVGEVTKTVNGGCNNAKARNEAFQRIDNKNKCN